MSLKNFYYKDIIVTFETSDFERIIFKHLKKSNMETGGILCGKYSTDLLHADISIVTEPPKGSRFGGYTFERSATGLPKYLKGQWKKGIFYLGEWHLHPYSKPTASGQDLHQIMSNSKDGDLKCPEPIMIIVGMKGKELLYNAYIVFNHSVNVMVESSKEIL